MDKQPESNLKLAIGNSPANIKGRKRRAPSGVNKIKLIADKQIKQAIEIAAIRNEVLS